MTAKKKIILIALSFVLALSAFAAFASYSVYNRITQAGGLKTLLEQALSYEEVGINSYIESTEVSFSFSSAPLRLTAKNIWLTAEDTSLTLPSSEFGFSIMNVLTGNFVPNDMQMSGLEIEVIHGAEGWHAGPSMALITSLMQGNAENALDSGALSSIRNIYIGNARVVIRRMKDALLEGTPETIELSPIGISMRYQNNKIQGDININNSLGGQVKVEFAGNRTGNEIQFFTSLSDVNMADIYPYLGVNIPEISDIGLLDGQVTLNVVDRKITALSGDLTSAKGVTDLPGIGAIGFDQASILFAYDAVQDLLTVSNFDMAVAKTSKQPAGRINFTGQLRNPSGEKPLVIAKLRGSEISFQQLMKIWPENRRGALRSSVIETLQGGQVTSLGLDVVGILHRKNAIFEITTFDLVSNLRDLDLHARAPSLRELRGKLGARLELSIGAKGRIDHASADLLLLDAEMKVAGRDETVAMEGIEFRAKLDGNVLTVTRGAIDARHLGQMAMVAKIELEPDWHPHRIDLSVKAEQIDKQLFSDLWPKTLRPRTRAWVAKRIMGGQINGLSLNLGLDLQRDEKPSIFYLNGKARLVNSALTYLEGMAPITNVNAPISFDGNFLRADIDTGIMDGIDVSGSRVIIRKNEVGPVVDLAILANGNFGGALRLINHPRLDLLSQTGLNLEDASGNIDTTMSIKWNIPEEGQSIDDVGGMDINLSASVIDASIKGLPQDIDLTDADMDMLVSNGRVNITARGKLDNATSVMSLIYNKNKSLDIAVNIPPSVELTELISRRTGVGMLGQASGNIRVSKPSGSPRSMVDLDLDLTDASFNIDRIGLIKLPSEPAQVGAKFALVNGKFTSVNQLNIDSEFLAVKGRLNFNPNGDFDGAFFDHVSWPGNELSNIAAAKDAEGVLNITANAHVIDLTPLRREESPGEGMALKVDLTANRIILDDKVSLAGNVLLETKEDGRGKAEFLGTLSLSDSPFMKQATMSAIFGGGQDLIDGRGLIGGVEAMISLSTSEDNSSLLVLRSNNAGQVLKSVGVVDAIRGGKLYMVAEFHDEDTPRSTVNFELEDFRIIEAPTAVRMMSVLSLSGLYSLIEGDGTQFNLGHAKVEILGGKQIIHHARATGDALAVDLVGMVDKDKGELEVSGALLPIYGITKLIGRVPLISEILTGIDNSGLLVTQFTIDGSLDDPQTNINLSSIVPGVFRDVFSPNWISRERQRIIGDEADDNASTAN